MTSLEQKLAELPRMKPAQLRAMWRECWRTPPPDLSPDLLRRGIAWKLQARVYGDLSTRVKRELERAADRLRKGESVLPRRSKLSLGTRLVREWRGTTYQVLVLESGFEFEGRHFRSLTQVAEAITGTHWPGPSFFGLRDRFPRKNATKS